MQCPACGHLMQSTKVEELDLEICRGGCEGVWFDHRELSKMDEPHEYKGNVLLDNPAPTKKVDREKKRDCPVCPGVILMRRFFNPVTRVEIDECAQCGGIFLDTGELNDIHEFAENPDEKMKQEQEAMDSLFAQQMENLKAESQTDLQKARTVARMLKFICPTYYIPGKQDWGAW